MLLTLAALGLVIAVSVGLAAARRTGEEIGRIAPAEWPYNTVA